MSEEKITDLYEWGNKDKIIRPNVVNENLPKDIELNTIKVATTVNADTVKATTTNTDNLNVTGETHMTSPSISGIASISGLHSPATMNIQGVNGIELVSGTGSTAVKSMKLSEKKVEFNGTLQPMGDNSQNIGTSSKYIKSLYANTIYTKSIKNGNSDTIINIYDNDTHSVKIRSNDIKISNANDVKIASIRQNASETYFEIANPNDTYGTDLSYICHHATPTTITSQLILHYTNDLSINTNGGNNNKPLQASFNYCNEFLINGTNLLPCEKSQNSDMYIIHDGTKGEEQETSITFDKGIEKGRLIRNVKMMFWYELGGVKYRIGDYTQIETISENFNSFIIPFNIGNKQSNIEVNFETNSDTEMTANIYYVSLQGEKIYMNYTITMTTLNQDWS